MTPERWQKVEQLCNAALEREASQRAAFLAQACQGDAELRREVESLLEQEKPAIGFLESVALEAAAAVLANMPGGEDGPSLVGREMGCYRIVSLLGAGGMGEVYQAHDTKLGRDVAIKVLPEAFAHDPERLSRFQREAKMLAALNHPNIATIHGLEQSDGVHYLVMELVSGETLAERVEKGALPLQEALKIAGQIAEALEAAHEKGVIHRDLKPANVKVTPEGKVKVLDFGLAKAFAGDDQADLSNAPTLTAVHTEDGRILGTPAYMSPEQARGKSVDKRTDIWAFGAVSYELLSGRPAFPGATFSDTIAAVLEREPDWTALPRRTPPSIARLLRRCLQKDRNLRLRDIGDARIEIAEALAAPPATAEPAAAATTSRARVRGALLWGLGAVLLGVAISGVALWNRRFVAPPQPVSRLVIALPPGQQLGVLNGTPPRAVALSPDGTRLAYVGIQGGTNQLFLRTMDSTETRPIPGSEGATMPFFSPDSQWVGFFTGFFMADAGDSKLKKVSVNGGAAVTLFDNADARLDVRDVAGASWGSQGTIVIGNLRGPLLQLSDAGGTPQPVTGAGKGEGGQFWPEFLPGGKAVLFTTGTPASSQIAVLSLATGERRNLVQGTDPRYAPSGHLVYLQGGTLTAVPFDLRRLQVTGVAVPMVEGVLQGTVGIGSSGGADYSLSATGSLVFVPAAVQSVPLRLVWVSRNGAEQPLAADAHAYLQPRLSPDGRRIAVGIAEKESQLWLYDLSRETLTRFTFQGSNNLVPFWTPDGKRIVFTSNKEGQRNLFWQLADGSGGLERLATSELLEIPGAVSPDGQLLAFSEVNNHTQYDIWVLRLSGQSAGSGPARKAQPFLQTPANENAPQFSPDGRWLAYGSDESGRYEIYVQPYPGPGGKWQISTEGGREPLWNRNGRELFYRNSSKLMAVEISTQPSFSARKPKVLFEGQYRSLPTSTPNYDVSADGQRFLMLKSIEQSGQINVVLNWFEELKQKVPTGTRR